ncbi:lipase maturation factor family protein [Skermania sp. ID1734]|uniref:lipase maturation factor family protein n=1 Tax=Skermania sp. ID1734 TaxID=2597516 RepID=UPI00117F04DE|nr:lipase maturation factor family protein [Skermania sp. ID1734]TSE00857.1 lipase maturation factor family protein [Skermania sp. ID1734]
MDWLVADNYWTGRLLFQRGLAAVYLVAFIVARNQFRALLGAHGLMPIPAYLARTRFRRSPSLFQLRYSDGLFAAVTWIGMALAALTVVGVTESLPLAASAIIWLLLWVLYLSIVNVGQTWYSFGWESLLLEAGFLAVFLGNASTPPPLLVLFLIRWLLFRLEFGAGLIKMRGDSCWRDLTCLYYHHETQPMPGPLSWYFHHLPKPLHRVEVAANHVTQLVVPFGLFFPAPISGIAAALIIVTQLWLVISGNFSWLNWTAIVLALSALPDEWLGALVPTQATELHATPTVWIGVSIALTCTVAVLSYWPVRNMLGHSQVMNASFNQLHLVNTYGAFGHVTRQRFEVIIQGTSDAHISPDTTWQEYEFKGKPGELRRWPRQFAPYHLRLDWLMWFAGISAHYAHPWFTRLLEKLLRNDRATLKLLRHNPFPDQPPRYVRARLYEYHFTTRAERRATGAWWKRELVGQFAPVVALADSRSE